MPVRVSIAFFAVVFLSSVHTSVSAQEQGEACSVPPSQELRERAKPPKKKRGMPNLSPDELREWGPIRVQAVISCEGKIVRVLIVDEIPPELAEKIHANLEGWEYRPASVDDEAIAMPFNLVLQEAPPSGR
ncbi:MAG: hypothetical protein DWQ30_02090 [Acidobacteria bacterium]|nr:MAG: hypothetical protein DWQ30_02090 [Acidobacteriota bacterium]